MWQNYNDGKKTTFESALTLVLEGVGTQLEVVCLKGYRTIKSLGTTVLDYDGKYKAKRFIVMLL